MEEQIGDWRACDWTWSIRTSHNFCLGLARSVAPTPNDRNMECTLLQRASHAACGKLAFAID